MHQKAPTFFNVAANQTATLDMSTIKGKVLDRVILNLGGGVFTKALITEIRIKANGKIIFQDSGSRIDARQQYKGIAASANFLVVDFAEIRAINQFERHSGSLDTVRAGVDTLSMEVDIGAATTPSLTATYEWSYPALQVDQGQDKIGKVLFYSFPIVATSSFFPLNIPYGKQAGTLLKRLHIFQGGAFVGTFNGISIKKDGVIVWENVKAVNDFNLTEYGRTPQANVYHLDFMSDGGFVAQLLDATNANMEYYLDVTVTTAGNLVVVAEFLDVL